MVIDPSGISQSIVPTLNAASNGLYTFVKVIGVLLVFGVLFYFVYQKKQYKYHVKLKMWRNRQFAYYESKAKLKEIDGARFLYIKGLRHTTTFPPAESITLSTNAQWVCEGYYDTLSGVIWSRDDLSKEDFERHVKAAIDGKSVSGSTSVNTHYQPMTTTERSLQANQVTKAVTRKGRDVWGMVWQIIPVVVLIVIFVLVLIFWKDIAQPVIELQQVNAKISEDNALMQQQNLRLYQMLTGGKGNGTFIVQELPADQQYFPVARPGGNFS